MIRTTAGRLGRWLWPNYGGLVVGLIFYGFALTPSLLPMPPVYQGIVAGLSFAFGYGIGVCLSWATRKLIRRQPPAWLKDAAWIALLILLPIILILFGIKAAGWQNDVRALIGEEPLAGHHIITIVAVATLVAAIVMLCARSIALSIRVIGTFSGRWVPARVGTAIGIVLTGVLLVLLYNGVLVRSFVAVSNNIYGSSNDKTDPGIDQPTSALRSGSPVSHAAWDTLGRQGRKFVAKGPTAEQLSAFSGQQATEPIRVYAGLQTTDDIEARAELAVQELERTGAFDRKVLAVLTATGTGWIDPQSADALEYMWNGDTALVSIQYSYLPSWISFLVNRQEAAEAGRTLFNAVYDRWDQLPVDERPQLIAYGLSLGSYGAQAAFSGIQDIQKRTDGALFMGTPSFTPLWQYFTNARDPGSPQWQPTYEDGQAVRFAANDDDLWRADTAWEHPRAVYLQHASDPVVWWSTDLIFHKPDWLNERRGPDVIPGIQWRPFVTFIQVTVNQFFAVSVPEGHGHNYGNTVTAAWAAIVPPAEWDDEQTGRLQQIIHAYKAE